MTADALCTRDDLETRFGALVVLRFADDTGEGDSEDVDRIIGDMIAEGCGQAYALLRPGYPTVEQVQKLVANDPGVRGAVRKICMDELASRKPEFLSADGTTPYTKMADVARSLLRAMAKHDQRPAGEVEAGPNALVPTITNRPSSVLVFAATEANPRGKGGF